MSLENPTTPSTEVKPPSKMALWAEERQRKAGNFIEKIAGSARDGISELFKKTFEVETIDRREIVKSILFTGSLATAVMTGKLI